MWGTFWRSGPARSTKKSSPEDPKWELPGELSGEGRGAKSRHECLRRPGPPVGPHWSHPGGVFVPRSGGQPQSRRYAATPTPAALVADIANGRGEAPGTASAGRATSCRGRPVRGAHDAAGDTARAARRAGVGAELRPSGRPSGGRPRRTPSPIWCARHGTPSAPTPGRPCRPVNCLWCAPPPGDCEPPARRMSAPSGAASRSTRTATMRRSGCTESARTSAEQVAVALLDAVSARRSASNRPSCSTPPRSPASPPSVPPCSSGSPKPRAVYHALAKAEAALAGAPHDPPDGDTATPAPRARQLVAGLSLARLRRRPSAYWFWPARCRPPCSGTAGCGPGRRTWAASSTACSPTRPDRPRDGHRAWPAGCQPRACTGPPSPCCRAAAPPVRRGRVARWWAAGEAVPAATGSPVRASCTATRR